MGGARPGSPVASQQFTVGAICARIDAAEGNLKYLATMLDTLVRRIGAVTKVEPRCSRKRRQSNIQQSMTKP